MVEILDGVRAVSLSKADGLDNEAYILDCNGGVVLVDVGCTPHDVNAFEAELREMGRSWNDVKIVFITHGHGDHIGNLLEIKKQTGAQIMAGAGDAADIVAQTGVSVDRMLGHGDYFDICGGIEVIHVPGHSPGNLSFYLQRQKAIIAGDTIFGDDQGLLHPPPEKYCLDVKMAEGEIKRLLFYDFDTLLLSHGRNVMKGAKKRVRAMCEALSSLP